MARVRDSLVYAVPFFCGEFDRAAGAGVHAVEGPVRPGSYATSIQIQNPDAARKVKFVVTGSQFLDGKAPFRGNDVELELAPRGVLRIDGTTIRGVLLKPKKGPPPAAPLFIAGLVTLDTDPAAPLDVVTVYTAQGFTAGGVMGGFSMNVQHTEGSLIKQPKPRK